MPPGTGDAGFTSLVAHVVTPLTHVYRPQLILLSAGYDAHRDDPLAGCLVSDGGYAAMASTMRRAAERLGAPVGVVLEGGYELKALGRGVVATMEALLDDDGTAFAPAVHPLSAAAAERLRGRWPELAAAPGSR